MGFFNSFLLPQHEIDDDGSDKERISVDEANRPLPVPKDGFTFESLIRNRTEVELFKEFLSKKHTKGNLMDDICQLKKSYF